MRRRLCDFTGLGVGRRDLLDNKGKIDDAFGNEVVKLYFKGWGGCDYKIRENFVAVGIEPSYQFQPLKIVTIHKDKKKSSIRTGRAFGVYGTGIRSTTKTYGQYKRKCKFTRFIDKWHPVLFDEGILVQ